MTSGLREVQLDNRVKWRQIVKRADFDVRVELDVVRVFLCDEEGIAVREGKFSSLAEAFAWIEEHSPLAGYERYARHLETERVTYPELLMRSRVKCAVEPGSEWAWLVARDEATAWLMETGR